MNRVQFAGRIAGPVLACVMLFLPVPDGLSVAGWRTAIVALWMAVWWMTEALPLAATSLLPLVLFPFLGILPMRQAAAPYAHHLIFLFMGGFLIARSMERWDLHRRIALGTVRMFGFRPRRMVLGFMVATAFLSMWVSNTATAIMMVPIGMAVLGQGETRRRNGSLGVVLMLGIAYSASIGGMATIIGTPPNTVMVAMVDKLFGQTITFLQWMLIGVPLSLLMLVTTWWLLTRVQFPLQDSGVIAGGDALLNEQSSMGPMTPAQKRIVAVGVLVACGWIFRGLVHLDFLKGVEDATIAMTGAILLFLIPSGDERGSFLLDWDTARTIPWGVMLLFGGGLSLAGAFMKSGLAAWIATKLSVLQAAGPEVLIIAVVLLTLSLTELTSNTATATLFIPLVAGLGIAVGSHPYVIMSGTAIAASFAFMLPVATPPNAVVFGSGEVTIGQMVRAGILLNLIGAVINVLVILYLLPLVWGLDLMQVPDWARMIGG